MQADSRDADRVSAVLGAPVVGRERLQSVWGGHGELVRYRLPRGSVVVKHIRPGRGSGRGHDRKLRSYEVEQTWYTEWAPRCDDTCRVARCLHAERSGGQWLFVLEDLDAAGFSDRFGHPTGSRLDACLRWLAAFHARFLGERPKGLWKTGTYWHLATRPDEHRTMGKGPLRDAAGALDARLSAARFQTLVHGDAKPANFCWSPDGRAVAAVDFQYVGGGCGMKDVAYLLSGEDHGTVARGLDVYFAALRARVEGDEVEREWRALFPVAAADFQRFLAGWAPSWRLNTSDQALQKQALRAVGVA